METLQKINIKDIIESPWQGRLLDFGTRKTEENITEEIENLAENIKMNGLINPVVLRQSDDTKYELIDGHRQATAIKAFIGGSPSPQIGHTDEVLRRFDQRLSQIIYAVLFALHCGIIVRNDNIEFLDDTFFLKQKRLPSGLIFRRIIPKAHLEQTVGRFEIGRIKPSCR